MDVAREHMDRDSALGFVLGYSRLGLECGQHETEIGVFDECPGVLARAPRRLGPQAIDLRRQIELHQRLSQR